MECKSDDIFYLQGSDNQSNFDARVDELHPSLKVALIIRLDMFCDSLIGKLFNQLKNQASGSLEQKGF